MPEIKGYDFLGYCEVMPLKCKLCYDAAPVKYMNINNNPEKNS